MRKRKWKVFAAWILAFSIVFGNSSFIVHAEEGQDEEGVTELNENVEDTQKTVSEMGANDVAVQEDEAEQDESQSIDTLAGPSGGTDENEQENSQYWVDFDCYPKEGDEGQFSWIYEGQKLCIDLNTDGLSGLSDYTVEWDVERADDEEESGDAVECVDGGKTNDTYIVLEGIEGYARVVASVYASGATESDGPIAEKDLFIEVRKPVYDYRYPWSEPGENQMIRYGGTFIDPWMSVWVEDSEYPYGEERPTKIESVEITGQYTWNEEQENWIDSDDQIMVLEGDENEGWYLQGDNFGKVDLTITYESINVENQLEKYYTEFYVNGDIFALNWEYPDGTDQMLRKSEMTIENISMWHDYLNAEEGVESEEIHDFSLSVTDEDGNATYDDGLINVQVGAENRSIKITSKNEEGETDIFLRGMMDGEEVCCVRIHINVTNSYCNLTPVSVRNVELGTTLDLSEIDWQLWSYDVDENGNPTEPQTIPVADGNIRFRLDDYDQNAWDINTDDNALLPTLTRKGNWGTDVQVIAEERMRDEEGTPVTDEEGNEIWYEIARRSLRFEWLDYWTDFTYSYGDRGNSVLFTDEPLTLTLIQAEDSPSILPEGYAIEWIVEQYNEEIDDMETATCVTYDESSDGKSITLTAVPGEEDENIGQWFYVHAQIFYGEGENKVEISRADTSAEVCRPELEYYFPLSEESWELKGWENEIGTEFGAWVKNAKYPEGNNIDVTIKDVSVSNDDPTEENDVIELTTYAENSGWKFTMANYGDATITLTIEDKINGVKDHCFKVHVGQDVTGIDLGCSSGTDQMLPGASQDITAHVWWEHFDDEDGYYPIDTSNLRVEWSLESGNDVVSIEQDKTDPRVLHVTASEDEDIYWNSAHIEARAYNEEDEEVAYGDCWIHVCPDYYHLSVNTLYVEPGSSFNMQDLGVSLKHYSLDMPEGIEIENTDYDFEAINNIGGISLADGVIQVDEDVLDEEGNPRYDRFTIYASCQDEEETMYFENWCEVIICKHQWDEGNIEKENSCTEEGVKVYSCDLCGLEKKEAIHSAGHKWGSWTMQSAATVFAPEKQVRTCKVCGAIETRTYGSKLTPTVKLPSTSLKMKVKQKTTAFKATEMANGDSVKSVTSSNTKILKVSGVKPTGTFTLTAQKKTGSATLTIVLASGLTKKVKVTVQKGAVKTSKISGLSKKMTISKGQTEKLLPIITPVTSSQKVTFSSSNKKIVTVTSKGVIKGKKTGKAKITVKSGAKKYVVTVTVK